MIKLILIVVFTNSLFSINIDLEIAKINKADKKQRYILMNNLKRRLFQENTVRRKFILEQMQKQRKHSKKPNINMPKHNMENRWHRKQH